MDYEIVRYREEHEAAVAELEQLLWRGDVAGNVAHLRWKYRETPLREHCFLFVALDAGKVVGVRGLVAGRWEARRAEDAEPLRFVALSAADLVIAPEHRNTGLYRKLTQGALSEVSAGPYALAFNFSASDTNRIASLAGGWRQAFAIDRWVRQPRPGAGRRLLQLVGLEGDATRRFEQHVDVSVSGRNGRVSLAANPRAHEMAALVARVGWSGRIRQLRDEAYFRWRYAGPSAVHRFVYCDDAGSLRGYLVLQTKPKRPGSVVVVDFEADSEDVLIELVEAAVARAGELRFELWGEGALATIGGPLAHLGFRRTQPATGVRGGGPALLMRVLDAAGAATVQQVSGRSVRAHEDWDLRPAYSDAY